MLHELHHHRSAAALDIDEPFHPQQVRPAQAVSVSIVRAKVSQGSDASVA